MFRFKNSNITFQGSKPWWWIDDGVSHPQYVMKRKIMLNHKQEEIHTMIFIIVVVLKPFEFLNVRFFHGAFTGGWRPCFAGAQTCLPSLPLQVEELLTLPVQGNLMWTSQNGDMVYLLCTGLSSHLSDGCKANAEQVYNSIQWSFTQRYGRRTLFSLFTAQNTE